MDNNIKFILKDYVRAENELVSNLANIASILYNQLEDINWLGFYLADNEQEKMYLGPFQGLQAVAEIAYSNGVCGHACTTKSTVVVPDVHCFEGHIACDLNSKSEIVVPVFDQAGNLFAIIDVDSPIKDRFGAAEQTLFEEVAAIITELL